MSSELAKLLCQLRDVAQSMLDLYEAHDELNDDVDISKVIPMSLDDWVCELDAKIDELS